mmetsp:Transcript_3887/g.8272  ORF Transcript_3887/g.8272 Transcript_3887/m.8272 type:complete len:238 (+) Transcript_3887:655-1368(+)
MFFIAHVTCLIISEDVSFCLPQCQGRLLVTVKLESHSLDDLEQLYDVEVFFCFLVIRVRLQLGAHVLGALAMHQRERVPQVGVKRLLSFCPFVYLLVEDLVIYCLFPLVAGGRLRFRPGYQVLRPVLDRSPGVSAVLIRPADVFDDLLDRARIVIDRGCACAVEDIPAKFFASTLERGSSPPTAVVPPPAVRPRSAGGPSRVVASRFPSRPRLPARGVVFFLRRHLVPASLITFLRC